MKLVFSEAKADYSHYIFPYAVWAFPETGETPGDLFRQGRIDLRKYRPSSENRRILRKGQGLTATLIPRAEFDYSEKRQRFYKTYADIKFGKDVMSCERLDSLFSGRITSHVLVFNDPTSGAEVGAVTLYLEPNVLAYYYYSFYDLYYYSRNLGM